MNNLNNQSNLAESIPSELIPRKFGRLGKIWLSFLLIIIAIGIFAYTRQLKYGLSVTGMGDYASWGIYISNFVFFVAISLVGSLIAAILKLVKASWSTPLTRISEFIAVAAIVFASLIIIIDMGRPDRIFNLFIHGRLQSPIIWDVIVISVYLVLGIFLLYFSVLPDFPYLLRHNKKGGVMHAIYKRLGGFWINSFEQENIRKKVINVLIICIIPVAFAIHTVTSWLFATTYRAGWDSTNFGPYFVSGAFYVGAGAVVLAMYVFRRAYRLENFITDSHFNHMAKLLVMLSLLYFYFNINEYLVPAYKMVAFESEHLVDLFSGKFAPLFWTVNIGGILLPILIMLFPAGRKPMPMFIVGIMVVVGAWMKRYLIVTPTMLHPFLPKADAPELYFSYTPTWEEWAITVASLAGVLLVITLLARIFPIIPIQETYNERQIMN